MARFTKNVIWTSKPPPGYKPVNGLLVPDRLAIIFNENNSGVLRNISSNTALPGFSAAPLSTTYTTSNAALTGGRRGTRIASTSTSFQADWGDSSLIVPRTQGTIMIGYRKSDTTNRASSAFGINNNAGVLRINASVPYSDGVVYWDWGTTGTPGRVSKSGLTFGDDIWAFTNGARGQEIWQNGILVASGADAGDRGSTSNTFALGNGVSGLTADLAEWDFFYMWGTQIPTAWIQQITERPYRIFDGSYKPTIWSGFVSTATPITETLSDSLSLSDDLLLEYGNILNDSLSLSDDLSIVAPVPGISLADALSLSDSVASTFGMILSEGFTLSDFLTYGLSLPLSDSDALSMSDAMTFLIGIGLGKSDTFTFSDVLRIAADVAKLLGDNILLSDFLAVLLQNVPAYSDTFELTDVARLILSLNVTNSDSLVLSDAVNISLENLLTVTESDTLNLSDSVEVSLSGPIDQYIRHWLNDVPR